MKQKKLIIVALSYVTAAALVAGGFALSSKHEADRLRLVNDAVYERAFSELCSAVGEIDSSLRKSVYSISPSAACAEYSNIFGSARAAQTALGELPFSSLLLEKTSGFLGSAGDYAFMLAKKASGGKERTDDESGNLLSLSQAAASLSACLTDIQSRLDDGSLSLRDLDAAQTELSESGAYSGTFSGSFLKIESEFPEIPSLIYDGPFSQHIKDRQPKLLEGLAAVSAEEALRRAAVFTGNDALSLSYERGGSLPVYCFTADRDGCSYTVEVTKAGGEILSIYSSIVGGAKNIGIEEAVSAAGSFLAERGFENMKESYWTEAGGCVLVNFAYTQDSVICYPDLIKVAVSLDTGNVCGYEALGYIMNHSPRTLPEVSVTEKQASSMVPADLEILSHALAVIPTSGKYEKLCHEYKCQSPDGSHCIIYVDAGTGEQEKILLLIEDENGTLAI